MNARLGRMSELQELLKQAESRTFMGDARVKIEGAAEGLWTLKHRPQSRSWHEPEGADGVSEMEAALLTRLRAGRDDPFTGEW
jgi:hypothetical protein